MLHPFYIKTVMGGKMSSSYTAGGGLIGTISLQRHLAISMSGESEDPSAPAKDMYKMPTHLL